MPTTRGLHDIPTFQSKLSSNLFGFDKARCCDDFFHIVVIHSTIDSFLTQPLLRIDAILSSETIAPVVVDA